MFFTEQDCSDTGECVSCAKCGRRFHVECSGIQKDWVGHLVLECGKYGLQCCGATDLTPRIKNISSEVFPESMPPVKKQTPTLLHWAKKRRIKRNLNVDSEGLMIKDKELDEPTSMQGTCENKMRTSAFSDAKVNLTSQKNCLSDDKKSFNDIYHNSGKSLVSISEREPDQKSFLTKVQHDLIKPRKIVLNKENECINSTLTKLACRVT